jgi:putative ABC transport system permease protein
MARLRDSVSSVADAIYWAALRALPEPIRGPFARDMAQMFRDRRRLVAGRPFAHMWLWLSALGDIARVAVTARLRPSSFNATARDPRTASVLTRANRSVGSIGSDIRFSLRLLGRDRAFTAVALSVLALGIGTASAAFILVNGLLFKPLPGHPAGVVAGLYSRDTTQPSQYRAFSYSEIAALRGHVGLFAELAAHNLAFAAVDDGGGTRQVLVEMVTSNFFATFGSAPILGRAFTGDEERPGSAAPVAMLSYAGWRRRGARPDILGQDLHLNGRKLTIVGVTEPGFGGSMAMVSPEIWVPLSSYDWLANDFMREGTTTPLADPRTWMLVAVAQLPPGQTIAGTRPILKAISAARAVADPALAGHQAIELAPLARMAISTEPETDGPTEGVATALLSLAGIVLVIASLNVANMILARGTALRREFAIRRAIGGQRGRLVRQLLTEAVVLSIVGGAGGLLVAAWASSMLVASLAGVMPLAITLDALPDLRVIGATTGFCLVSAITFSLWPSWTFTRRDLAADLGGRSVEAVRRTRSGARHLLVGGQVALSLVMLTAGAMFVRSARDAASANPGFTLDHGLLAHVDASLSGRSSAQATAIYMRILERLRAEPGLRFASISTAMPFDGHSSARLVQTAGARLPPGDPGRMHAEFVGVGADYFRAIELPVVAGRAFSAAEEFGAAGRRLAVIDQPLSRALFGGASPVGRTIQYESQVASEAPVVLEVVGLVPGVKTQLFDPGPMPHIYVTYGHASQTAVYLHALTTQPTPSAEASRLAGLRALLHEVDPDLPILALDTRATYRDRSPMLVLMRTAARLFAVFGLAALVLAAAGIYGVKAYVVARRTHEIGIRMALGAARGEVIWLIAREGLLVGVAGLAVGAALSVVAGFGLRSMTYAARGADSSVMAVTIAVLFLAAVMASLVPARRALNIDPVLALRAD